ERLRISEHGEWSVRRHRPVARFYSAVPGMDRGHDELRGDRLSEEVPDPARRVVQRTAYARLAARSARSKVPQLARFYTEQPTAGAAGSNRLLPGLSFVYQRRGCGRGGSTVCRDRGPASDLAQ